MAGHHILCFTCFTRRFTTRAGVRNLRERAREKEGERGEERVREGRRGGDRERERREGEVLVEVVLGLLAQELFFFSGN